MAVKEEDWVYPHRKNKKSKKKRGHMKGSVAEGGGEHNEGVFERGSGNVLDGGTAQGISGHIIESVNVYEPYGPAPLEGLAQLLEPTVPDDGPPTPVPTELSVHQQVALGSLMSFFSSFRRYPPTSLLTARTPSSTILDFIQDSGYPVRQLKTLLQQVFASCSKYADISTKNPLEVVREYCDRRLNEAEDTLAVRKSQLYGLGLTQYATMSSLKSVYMEFVTISQEAEELHRQLEIFNKRAAELSAQIPLLKFKVAAQEQALHDLNTILNQLVSTFQKASDKAVALQDDVAFCETSHASLLHDALTRARADLEELLSSFPSIGDQTY